MIRIIKLSVILLAFLPATSPSFGNTLKIEIGASARNAVANIEKLQVASDLGPNPSLQFTETDPASDELALTFAAPSEMTIDGTPPADSPDATLDPYRAVGCPDISLSSSTLNPVMSPLSGPDDPRCGLPQIDELNDPPTDPIMANEPGTICLAGMGLVLAAVAIRRNVLEAKRRRDPARIRLLRQE